MMRRPSTEVKAGKNDDDQDNEEDQNSRSVKKPKQKRNLLSYIDKSKADSFEVRVDQNHGNLGSSMNLYSIICIALNRG